MLLTPAQIKWKSFELRQNSFFLTWCGCVSCLCAYFGVGLLPRSYQYPNLSEGADSVGGVTSSGRVWSKMQESGARNVVMDYSVIIIMTNCCHYLPWWRQLLWGPSASPQNDTTFRRKKKNLNLPESPSSPCSLKMAGPLMWRYSYRLGRGKLGSPVHNSRISKMVSVTRLCSGIIKTKWSRSSKVVLQLEKMIRPCKELTSPWIRHVSITTALCHNSHKLCHGKTLTDCTNADVLARTHRSLWERRQLAAWDWMPSQPRLSQNEAK